MDGNITVKTRLQKEDIRTYAAVKFFNSLIFKLIAVFTVLHLLISIARSAQSGQNNYLISGIVFFVLIALAAVASVWLSYTMELKKFAQNRLLQTERSYVFTGEGLTATYCDTTSRIEWSNIYQAVEYQNCVFIYLSPVQMLMIPKRNFSGDGLEEFLALLQARVRKCRLLKKYSRPKL